MTDTMQPTSDYHPLQAAENEANVRNTVSMHIGGEKKPNSYQPTNFDELDKLMGDDLEEGIRLSNSYMSPTTATDVIGKRKTINNKNISSDDSVDYVIESKDDKVLRKTSTW